MVPSHYFYTENDSTESTTLRPYIDSSTPTNVTVIKGKTAMLACVVRNVGKAAVSLIQVSFGVVIQTGSLLWIYPYNIFYVMASGGLYSVI